MAECTMLEGIFVMQRCVAIVRCNDLLGNMFRQWCCTDVWTGVYD